jgi:hypothetical protein
MSKRSMISRKHKKFTYLIIIVFLISIFGGLFSNFHSTQRSVPGSGQGVANLGQEYFIGNNESLGTKPAYSSILHGTGFLMSSLVYKDFGYSITSAAKNYGSVGVKVEGVYGKKIAGSSKYSLVGVEKLKPGDIFTFWNSDQPARTHIGHVAIYMGVINGKPCIINTCKGNPTAIGIINDFSYWYGSSLIEVRRVLPASAFVAGQKIIDKGPVIPAMYQIIPDRAIVMPKDLSTGF